MSAQDLFQQAQLAEAAYADFVQFPDLKTALEKEGMSTAQATDFATHWSVVDHLPNTASGFSATLFRRIDNDPLTGAQAGDLVFALRGTEAGAQFELKGSASNMFWRNGHAPSAQAFFSGIPQTPVLELKGSASNTFQASHATSPTH